jgi:hypothetical protein
LCNTFNFQLCEAVRLKSYKIERSELENQLCITARPKLALAKAKPESIFNLLEAERAIDARRSPLEGLDGQWALLTVKEAVGPCLRTLIATV